MLFRNGHVNSIYPTLFRRTADPGYERRAFDTPDNDFIDVDEVKGGHRRIAILCHGLEGSSKSHYIMGTTGLLVSHNWDIAAMNFRGCSGRMNEQLRMYHSGATDDLHVLVEHYRSSYDEIVLIGFSLGGNLVLKYMGEEPRGQQEFISGAIAFSVPTDLAAGSRQIGRRSNYIYEQRFLRNLKTKIRAKHEQYPDRINLDALDYVQTLYDFDDIYTSRIHGFLNAEDYYSKCSCGPFIPDIKKPALIVNALDDPFLPDTCYPEEVCKKNPSIDFLTPKWGGHVGFVKPGETHYWNEELAVIYLESISRV